MSRSATRALTSARRLGFVATAAAAAAMPSFAHAAAAGSSRSASSSAASATPFACERKDVAPGRKVGATGLPMDGPDGKNADDVLQ